MSQGLFKPTIGAGAIRDPQDNSQDGMIVGQKRYSKFGGLTSGNIRGLHENEMTVKTPESTQHKVPVT